MHYMFIKVYITCLYWFYYKFTILLCLLHLKPGNINPQLAHKSFQILKIEHTLEILAMINLHIHNFTFNLLEYFFQKYYHVKC